MPLFINLLPLNNTWTGANTWSKSGGASVSAVYLNGALFTGGSGTTTFPLALIEPSGTTASSTWAVNGTALGINLTTVGGRRFVDFKAAGVTKFFIDTAGTTYSRFFQAVDASGTVKSYLDGAIDGTWQLSNNANSQFINLSFPSTNVLQLGNLAAAAPVAQTLQSQGSRAGTDSNTAGANLTIASGQGTGTGTGSDLIFQTPVLVASGSGAQTMTTALTIKGASQTVQIATAKALAFASGTNQRAGNTTLVGGTVTVSNTTVTANTVVMLTRKTSGGTIGTAITYTVSAATSFTVNSDNILDTSTFSYMLLEVP